MIVAGRIEGYDFGFKEARQRKMLCTGGMGTREGKEVSGKYQGKY